MGRRPPRYVFHGADAGLEDVLPGVKVHVLGPPTLEQSDRIERYASRSPDEYWLRLKNAALRLAGGGPPPFAREAGLSKEAAPAQTRWLIHRLRRLRSQQALELVRRLDGVLNNTSVVLLLEVGPLKLLFPGDAQLENWAYALEQPGTAELLAGVDFYKVGHHGSLNATPRKLVWENFQKRGHGLSCALSTLPDVHGGKNGRPTEVPRGPLVSALQADSALTRTDALPQEPGVFAEISLAV
jgi:hypothetical protein